MKPTIVVADTSPLIALAVMDLLPALPRLFELIYVPAAVRRECLADLTKPRADEIRLALENGLLIEKTLTNRTQADLLAQILDQGEAEAIALAKELNTVVLMDERSGRQIASREGIHCIGSLYCLVKAKQKGIVDAAAPKIARLREHGYYLHESLIQTVLTSCRES